MPYVHVRVGRPLTDQERDALGDRVGRLIEVIPDKSFVKTMIDIDDDCRIYRGGRRTACAFIETQLRRPNETEAKRDYAEGLFTVCQDVLGLSNDQVYLTVVEVDHWGSSGRYR
ncbi:MAG: hypothetical protein LBK54_05790 [Propionibacteriaceae bacterium]|jgi:phenylpyruvate tautomerase PptA (4-oxalocrotonate tautomerase family)|nr:hypothetical protein [Propionibacteriaceae bacterium]